jgi:hypothetical protein
MALKHAFFVALVAKADEPTAAGHIYPRAVWHEVVQRGWTRIWGGAGSPLPKLLGVFGGDSGRLEDSSHYVDALGMSGDHLEARIVLLDTPRGRALDDVLALHLAGKATLQASTRGEGEAVGGVIQPGYELRGVDFIGDVERVAFPVTVTGYSLVDGTYVPCISTDQRGIDGSAPIV